MSLKYTKLGEYATIQGGYAYKSQDFQSTGKWPVLKIKNIKNSMISYDDTSFVTEDIASATQKWMTKEGDVLISMTGSGPSAPDSLVGKVARVCKGEKRALINQRVGRLVLKNNNEIDSDFLFYLLSSKECQNYLVSNSTGSANQVNISSKLIESVNCPIISFSLSKEIAEILKSLDTKIRLLSETNSTLESTAQALFRSWFIDFDPVHAKAEGREPEGVDAETAALFPDSFEESESGLGLIPKGWVIGKIEQLLELAYGKALKAADRIFGSVPVYGSGGVTGHHNEALINESSVIVGRKGTVGSLYWEDQPFFPIDTVFYVKAKVPLTYCYYLLQTLGLTEMNTDGAVPGLNRNNVYRLQITMSSNEIIQAFDDVVMPLRKKISHNLEQINILIKLRDNLLPRLISGELLLPESEKVLKEYV